MKKAEFQELINKKDGTLKINEQFYLTRYTKNGMGEQVDKLMLNAQAPLRVRFAEINARDFQKAKEEIAERMKEGYLELAEEQVKRFMNGK